MNTKITVVVDNISQGELHGEWGLALFVEHGVHTIMADVGASNLFAQNMHKLNLELRRVEYATLSHAHFDHSNGMARFFQENPTAKFYLREGACENCYAKRWIFRKYIGLPRNILANYADRIEFVSGDTMLYEGAWLIGHKTPGLEAIGRREMMFQRTKEGFRPDDFSHEQSLVLDTEKGLVIINCCSHGGAATIISEVAQTFPDKQVYGLIGGFHLFNKSEEEVRAVARKIKETGIRFVCTGHCTGKKAYGILQEELGDLLHQLHVGLIMEF